MEIEYRRTRPNPDKVFDVVPVGKDLAVPPNFEMEIRHGDGRPDLVLDIEVRGGVPQCRRAELRSTEDGREVLASDLRGVLLEDLLESAVRQVSLYMSVEEQPGGVLTRFEPAMGEAAGQDVLRQFRAVRREARRRVTDDFLRSVAEVYRANVDGNPTAAVSQHTGRSHRTAALYVQQARDKGFLGRSMRGKAGEASQ